MWGYIFLISMLGIARVAGGIFDCRNPGFICKNGGTCNTDTKVCDCMAGYDEEDCGVTTADKDQNECAPTSPCLNGGTCMDSDANGAAPTCSCTPDYTGTNCETKRWSVTCHKDNMEVELEPGFTPNGDIYTYNKKTCIVGQDANNQNLYTKTLQYTASADCEEITSTLSGTNTVWEQKFVVQENVNYLTDADFVVIFKCVFDGNILVKGTVDTVTIDDSTSLGDTTHEANIGSVALVANPADTSQILGTAIEFTLTGNADLAKIKVETVSVKGGSATAVEIISGACRVANMEAFVKTNPVLTSGNELEIKVTLFVVKFNDASDIEWTFTVKTCLEGATTDCDAIVCPSKRRRRAAEQLTDNSTQIYNYAIDVVENFHNNVHQQRRDESQTDCVNVNKMTAAVVAMAVACFILLVICLVFIVRMLSSRRNVEGSKQNLYEDGPYSVPRMVVTKQ